MGAPDFRFSRLLRHLSTSSAKGRRAYPQPALAEIATAIAAGEASHRGELRLIVEAALPFELVWAGVTNRQRALSLFAEYGVWDTEDNCGVLIYVNLAERAVDIVADRAIGRKIDAATWQAMCATMTAGFANGEFRASTLAAIEHANALLREHFPATGARLNELPDSPLVL
ncbi:MAG: TPM domain-containing protein [Massilia sp.]